MRARPRRPENLRSTAVHMSSAAFHRVQRGSDSAGFCPGDLVSAMGASPSVTDSDAWSEYARRPANSLTGGPCRADRMGVRRDSPRAGDRVMCAVRLSSRIALAALPLSFAACVSYPFLDEEATPNFLDGVGSVSTPGSNSGGGSIGPANTNSANENTNAPELPRNATGDVAQELCDSFIVISERDGSRLLHVYELTGDGSFADWSVGDDVGFV